MKLEKAIIINSCKECPNYCITEELCLKTNSRIDREKNNIPYFCPLSLVEVIIKERKNNVA